MLVDWNRHQTETMTLVDTNKVVVRLAKAVSDLEPSCVKLYGDKLLTFYGYYNKRGYVVGYSLDFKRNPKILLRDFYVVLDYVKEGKTPDFPSFPKLPKKDSKVCLVKYGNLLSNRLYTLIYRKKRDV